jgi:hypothetical protein
MVASSIPLVKVESCGDTAGLRRAAGEDDQADLFDPRIREGEPAGTGANSFIPFATNGSGCVMFVDSRPGPRSGCVTEFQREDADYDGPRWDSVAAMLEAIATGLEQDTPIDEAQPVVADGLLDWDLF